MKLRVEMAGGNNYYVEKEKTHTEAMVSPHPMQVQYKVDARSGIIEFSISGTLSVDGYRDLATRLVSDPNYIPFLDRIDIFDNADFSGLKSSDLKAIIEMEIEFLKKQAGAKRRIKVLVLSGEQEKILVRLYEALISSLPEFPSENHIARSPDEAHALIKALRAQREEFRAG